MNKWIFRITLFILILTLLVSITILTFTPLSLNEKVNHFKKCLSNKDIVEYLGNEPTSHYVSTGKTGYWSTTNHYKYDCKHDGVVIDKWEGNNPGE